ncbi:MAG: FmdB family zinc ribbon protein [Planctomycetota bacterium]
MPTYEYKCGNCDHLMEKFQSITANPIKKCPECGKLKLQRLLGTGAGLIFKGSGFYETDYRSDSYKKGAENAKPKTDSTKKDNKRETKKAESKPEKTPSKKDKKPA